MSWGRLDDSFYDNLKIEAAGNEVAGAQARLVSYCCKHHTDGWVDAKTLRHICVRPSLIRKMIVLGFIDVYEPTDASAKPSRFSPKNEQKTSKKVLKKCSKNIEEIAKNWRKKHLEFRVHDFLKYNPSAEEYKAMQEVRSLAGKRGAESRWGSSDGKCHGKPIADPDPDPDPLQYIKGSRHLAMHEVEKLGFDAGMGALTAATALGTWRSFQPIYEAELHDVLRDPRTEKGWAYMAEVFRDYRKKRSRRAPSAVAPDEPVSLDVDHDAGEF